MKFQVHIVRLIPPPILITELKLVGKYEVVKDIQKSRVKYTAMLVCDESTKRHLTYFLLKVVNHPQVFTEVLLSLIFIV